MLKTETKTSFGPFSQEKCEYSDDDIKNRNNFILKLLFFGFLCVVVSLLFYLIFNTENCGIIIAVTDIIVGVVTVYGTLLLKEIKISRGPN